MEGYLAVREALVRYDPSKGQKDHWVFQTVVRHLRRILSRYLPVGQSLTEWEEAGNPPNGERLQEETLPEELPTSVATVRLALLLALAPPSERRYVLHELLGWEKPPRYCKTRLREHWQNFPWLLLLTDQVRNRKEREQLLRLLYQQAQKGDEWEQEIAGLALVVVAHQTLCEQEQQLLNQITQTLLRSPKPLLQLIGVWVIHQSHPEPWSKDWIDQLEINTLGGVLESRYAKPKSCECPSPLCLHYYPDQLQRFPDPVVFQAVIEAFERYSQRLTCQPNGEVRMRGRLMAKALGLYLRNSPSEADRLLPKGLNRADEMLRTIVLARVNPPLGLEQATSWLPKAPTLLERLSKAMKSPDPMERSSALYAARGLSLEEKRILAQKGFKDPLVFVRFSVLRTLSETHDWEPLYQELLHPHEHKRLLHRCILNTLARMDLERVQPIAAQIYLGQGKEAWREDPWLCHDAGYILLKGAKELGNPQSAEALRSVLLKEPRPSPFALLPAIQAFEEGTKG